jgi:hypothetical protein
MPGQKLPPTIWVVAAHVTPPSPTGGGSGEQISSNQPAFVYGETKFPQGTPLPAVLSGL